MKPSWDVWRLSDPSVRVRVEAHRAFDAWQAAYAKLENACFSDCGFELVKFGGKA